MDNRHSVLLVDDERSILDLLKLQLESEGYQVRQKMRLRR